MKTSKIKKMKTLSENRMECYSSEFKGLSPYGIYLTMRIIDRNLKEFYDNSEGDDRLILFIKENQILTFDHKDLMKYITPEQVNNFHWTIEDTQDLIAKYFEEWVDLYIQEVKQNQIPKVV